MSNITHGMDVDQVDDLGNTLVSQAARLRSLASETDGRVNRAQWHGPDGTHFTTRAWPAHRSTMHIVADQIEELGRKAKDNAASQRLTSDQLAGGGGLAAGGSVLLQGGSSGITLQGPGAVAPLAPGELRVVGAPRPPSTYVYRPSGYVVSETNSSVQTQSGAILSGDDGSQLALREMSDGTFQVVVGVEDGLSADLGDAYELANIARGNFFSDPGVTWDLDVGVHRMSERVFTFTDEESARLFHAELHERQHEFLNRTVGGGLSISDIHGANAEVGDRLTGDLDWAGHRSSTFFRASGSLGVDAGGVSSEVGLTDITGYSAETFASDGTTGELSVITGSANVTGELNYGGLTLDAGGAADYERTVHLVRNEYGTPVRLEVEERWGVSAETTSGARVLGTGATGGFVTGGELHDTKIFDLTNPSVSSQFDFSATDASSLQEFAAENAQLGDQTVVRYNESAIRADWSLLFSGKGEEIDGNRSAMQVATRPASY